MSNNPEEQDESEEIGLVDGQRLANILCKQMGQPISVLDPQEPTTGGAGVIQRSTRAREIV